MINDDPNYTPPTPEEIKATTAIFRLQTQVREAASWFFVVAALSVVNTLSFFFNGGLAFIFGLGITQIIDGIGSVVIEEMAQNGDNVASAVRIITIVLDLVVVAVFVGLGWLARKQVQWAFLVGLVLYGLDALLLLFASSYLDVVIHVYVLYRLFSGWRLCRQVNAQIALSMPNDSSPTPPSTTIIY